MLGSFSHISPFWRIVALSSFAGFLFLFYLILVNNLSKKLNILRPGLTFLICGVLGNVIDRLFLGGAIDFVPLYFATANIADIFQWIGALMILYSIFKREEQIWVPDNQRGQYLVNARHQLWLASKAALAALSSSILLIILALAFIQSQIPENFPNKSDLLLSMAFISIFLSLSMTLIIFYYSLKLTNRSAGPLYAFERYVDDLLNGERYDLYLREGDHHQHLKKVAKKLKKHFDKSH